MTSTNMVGNLATNQVGNLVTNLATNQVGNLVTNLVGSLVGVALAPLQELPLLSRLL